MPSCLPATSIHQRIKPFTSPVVCISSRATSPARPFSLPFALLARNPIRPRPHEFAFQEQVVCFTVRAPFASLFVHRSKAGGLQPAVAMAAARGRRGGRGESVLFIRSFFHLLSPFHPLPFPPSAPVSPPRCALPQTRESLRATRI